MVKNLRKAYQEAGKVLKLSGIEEPYLEAEVLLRHVLGLSREQFYLSFADMISTDQKRELEQLIQRRLQHEPIAYITGYKEFLGLDFIVTRDTLIPRPETELLVEKALELTHHGHLPLSSAADVGTGCGCIGITLAANLPYITVYATDISASALEVSATNCRRHEIRDRVQLRQGNLLEPINEQVELIVANLPYVSDSEFAMLSDDIRLFEPMLGLNGGCDGLRQTKELIAQAKDKLNPEGVILLEISPYREAAVVDFISHYFPQREIKAITDLNGYKRAVMIGSGRRV